MKRPLPLFFVLIMITAALLVPASHADVVFLSNNNLGSAVIICQSQTCYAGECFTMATSYFLTQASFSVSRTGNPTGSFIGAEIETASGATRSCLGTGTAGALSTSSTTYDQSTLGAALSFKSFSFNSYPLVAGSTYELSIVFHCSVNCSGGDFMSAGFSNIGGPAGQNGNRNQNGNGWDCQDPGCPSNRDAGFSLTGIPVGAPAVTQTICLGNCGTLTNTNSTSAINFNASITIFTIAQTTINGFVLNVSSTLGKSYSNGMTVYLGLYIVDRTCTATNQPFTAQCPGSLVKSQSFTNPSKGTIFFTTNSAILTGQWTGIAISASFKGLVVNDTNTQIPLYQTAGIMPSFISQSVGLGNSNANLRMYISGSAVSPSNNPLAGCTSGDIPCTLSNFVTALGGNLLGGLAAFGLLFGFTAGFMLYVGRERDPQTRVVTGNMFGWEMFLFVGVIFMLIFYAAGIFPIWVPVLIMVVFAWLISETLWSRRKSGGSV